MSPFAGLLHIEQGIVFRYSLVPVTVTSLRHSVVGDVTARRSKMHGEFASLKQRPITSLMVCYRIELAVAWLSESNTSAWHSNNFTQGFFR